MKKIVLSFCGTVWLGLFCGCIDVTASFKGIEAADYNKTPNYKVPVKFYLQELYFADFSQAIFSDTLAKAQHKRDADIVKFMTNYGSVFKAEEREKLRKDIVRYFPGIFTEDPQDGLTCRIIIYNDAQPEEHNYWSNHGLLGIFSFISLGLLPWKQEKTQNLIFKIQIEELSGSTKLPLFMKYRNSAGILGILGLQYLLSPAENAWFYGDSERAFNVLNIKEQHRKDFAALIVSEFCKISKDKVEELYLSRKTQKSRLLE